MDVSTAISGQKYLYANLEFQIYEGYHFSITFKETPSAGIDSLAPKDSPLQGWEGEETTSWLTSYNFTTLHAMSIYAKRNLWLCSRRRFCKRRRVHADLKSQIDNLHLRPSFFSFEKHSFHSTACAFRTCCRSCCVSTLWIPLGPDLRCARKYTVHHPTVGGSQGRVRVLIRPLLEHHEEAVVQFLDASGLALPVCFQECAASWLQWQKTRKDDKRVLEYHRHSLAATHLVPSYAEALLPFQRRTSSCE